MDGQDDSTLVVRGSRASSGTLVAPASARRASLPLPETLGHYRIDGVLGRGGMGIVYRAHDPTLDRTVAVKVLAPAFADDTDARERFLREARAMARVQHRNVAQVYFAGEDGGIPFFAMELVAGETAHDRVERGPLAIDEALDIVMQAAAGLQAAHQHGVIHRDVKPSNLMCGADGLVKVLDFGLARATTAPRVTAANMLMGSPDYMSPEMGRGEEPDHRSDIYALGVTLYHLIAGRVPFDGGSPLAIIHKHVNEPCPPLDTVRADVPASVCRLVERMLAKDPEARHQAYGPLLFELASVRQSPSALIVREWNEASPHNRFAAFCAQVVLSPRRAFTPQRFERLPSEIEGFVYRAGGTAAFTFSVAAPHEVWGPPWILPFGAFFVLLPYATRGVDVIACRLAGLRPVRLELLAVEAYAMVCLIPLALAPWVIRLPAGAAHAAAALVLGGLAALYLRARAAGLAAQLRLAAGRALVFALATSVVAFVICGALVTALSRALRP